MVCNRDRGVEYFSIRYTERLVETDVGRRTPVPKRESLHGSTAMIAIRQRGEGDECLLLAESERLRVTRSAHFEQLALLHAGVEGAIF